LIHPDFDGREGADFTGDGAQSKTAGRFKADGRCGPGKVIIEWGRHAQSIRIRRRPHDMDEIAVINSNVVRIYRRW
jgi:hypothetical protein